MKKNNVLMLAIILAGTVTGMQAMESSSGRTSTTTSTQTECSDLQEEATRIRTVLWLEQKEEPTVFLDALNDSHAALESSLVRIEQSQEAKRKLDAHVAQWRKGLERVKTLEEMSSERRARLAQLMYK